jgi:DNA-binding MarR family transcriptional regulator
MKNSLNKSLESFYDSYFGINAIYDRWAKLHGLTSGSLFVLYIIHEYPIECTQRFICDKLFYPKQTVNAILNSFIQQGYVITTIAKEDKRSKTVSFTENGQKYADELLSKLRSFEEEALINMNIDERHAMIRGTANFYEQLKNILDSYEQS